MRARVSPILLLLLPLGGLLVARPAVAESGAESGADVGQPCSTDDQCGLGTYCQRDADHSAGSCQRVRRHLNVLYMFYRSRDRTFTEALGLYWHQRGARGYRVAFPLYWSFWSPERQRRMVLPFYFHHVDHQTGTRQTVVPPVQVRRDAEGHKVRVWPLFFYAGYKDGGSSWTAVPFVHRSRVAGRSTTIVPLVLSYARSDDEARTAQGLIGGLFYWKNTPTQKTRALLPLVYHARATGGERSFTWIAPLNFYSRRRDAKLLVAAPLLLHYHDSDETATLSLTPPLYHYRSRSRQRARLYLPPLLYSRTGKDRWGALGPAYAYRDGAARGFGLAPLLFAGWSPHKRHLALTPLLLYRSWSGARGTSRQLLSPLGYYERDVPAQSSQLALLAPPYYRLRSPRLAVDLIPPLLGRWHDRQRDSTTLVGGPLVLTSSPGANAQVFFPLFWRLARPQAGRSTLVTGPGYLHRQPDAWHAGVAPLFFAGASRSVAADSAWRYHGLLPAWWHTSRADRSFTWAAPLNFYRRRGTTRRLLSVPLFYHVQRPDRHTTLALAPPIYLHRSPQRTRLYLPPLLAYHRTGVQRSVGVGPAYYHDHGDATYLGLAPLFFSGWSPTRRHLVVFPALWHARSPGRDTWVAGTSFLHRRDDAWHAGVAPLFFAGASRNAAADSAWRYHGLLPAWWHTSRANRSFTWAAPLNFYRRRGTTRRLLSVPLFYHVQRPDRHTTLALAPPMYLHRSPQRTRLYLPPLLAYHRTGVQRSVGVGPAYYHDHGDATYLGLAPLFFSGWSPTRRHLVVFPALWHARSPGRNTWVAGTGYYHRRDDRRYLGLAPLLFSGWSRAEKRRHLVLFPALWHFRTPGTNTWVAGPAYYRRDDEARSTSGGLVPLVFHHRSPTSFQLTSLPLFHYASERARDGSLRQRTLLAPIGLFEQDREAGRTELALLTPPYYRRRDRRWEIDLAPPLYGRVRDREARTTTSVFFPAFLRRRGPDGQSFNLAGPAFWSRDKQGYSAGLAPLLFFGRREQRRHAVLFPLLWHFSDGRAQTRSSVLFPLLWHVSDGRAQSSFTLAGLYSRRRRPDLSEHAVWPLLHYQRRQDPQAGTSHVRATLLPLAHYRRDGDQRLFVSPLGGFAHAPGKTRAVLGPLYWASSTQERSLAAVPLFFATWKRGGFTQQHRFALVPAFYYSRHAGRTTSLCTPVAGFSATPRARLWYAGPYFGYRSDRTSVDMAPPLFVRHRDNGRQRTTLVALPGYYGRWSPRGSAHVFAPLVWRFSRPDRDSTVVFPAVWDFRRRGVARTTGGLPALLAPPGRARGPRHPRGAAGLGPQPSAAGQRGPGHRRGGLPALLALRRRRAGPRQHGGLPALLALLPRRPPQHGGLPALLGLRARVAAHHGGLQHDLHPRHGGQDLRLPLPAAAARAAQAPHRLQDQLRGRAVRLRAHRPQPPAEAAVDPDPAQAHAAPFPRGEDRPPPRV